MARKLATFDFTRKPVSKRPTPYPWEEWFDGDIWYLERGLDFDLPISRMAMLVRSKSAHYQGKTHVAQLEDQDALVIQRFDIPSPGDQKRAEAKAKRDAKKANP